jgi:hypothetical protein
MGGGGSPPAAPAAPPPPLRGGPPPRDELGEEFSRAADRLAGIAGILFGWTPDIFWKATPAELGALVRALAGDDVAPPGASEIARLKELFPDG